ncbi:site-specific integrase, partial [Candidatus Collierbacteria bacterium]|nr:site-specific integrase [Candidatus Collierbacteria bacterium]
TDQIQSTESVHHLTPEKLIQQFRQSLTSERKTPATIKNYISDVNHFWVWIANLNKSTATKAFYQSIVDPQLGPNLDKIISKNILSRYQNYLKDIQTSTSVINRRESALKKFCHFAYSHKLIPQPETTPSPNLLPLFKNTPPNTISAPSGLFAKTYYYYHRLPIVPYLHLALLVLFGSAITIFGYNQVFKEAGQGQAYPTNPVKPNRQLSFQGRLTDNNDSPISETNEASFKLWNQAEEGQELYSSGACAVTPDPDGIFNVVIGNSPCGSEIDSNVFSENKDVYLEVSVGGQTLSPRQQIATVGYALNSETLQGYPASPSATENTIPIVNNDGQIILGSLSPSIESASGTFALKGQALTLSTNPGSDGNIIIAPDGTGQVKIMGGTTKKTTLFVSNANLTTGSLIEGYIGNNTSTGNLLHLASGAKMINYVTINAKGQTLIEPASKGKAAFILNQLDTGPIFTASSGGTPRFLITNDGRVGI